jgi:hypothetical protein
VLSHIDRAKDLLWLDMVSRVFYVFARHDKLWRAMCFKRHRGGFRFKRTWRYTALLPAELEVRPEEYPEDLRVEHFVSELFYRQWYLGHCDKKAFDITVCHIEKRAGLSVEEFDEKYLRVGRPVVITDAAKHWTALKWTPDSMLETYGDCEFKLNWGEYDEAKGKYKRIHMKLRDFWYYARQQHDQEPGYVFDGGFWKEKRVPAMLAEFDRTRYFREDLFSVLGSESRPDFRWFLAGPAGSGSPWHTDPHATSAWNGLLYGRKRWALYPPQTRPPGLAFADGRYAAPKAFRWFLEVYPFLKPEERPIELIQEAGEVIFVPSGWWHTVLNVTETLAVTQNWIDRYNFHVAWTDIQTGDPELRDAFRERLEYVRPELFEEYEKQAAIWVKEGKMPTALLKKREKE